MGKNTIVKMYTPPIHTARFARNGKVPSGPFMRKCAMSVNTVAAYSRRLIGQFARPIQLLPVGQFSGFEGNFVFRTGKSFDRVTCLMGIAPADNVAAANIRARLYIHDDAVGTGVPEVSNYAQLSSIDTGTLMPADVSYHIVELQSGTGANQVDEDKLYWGSIQVDDYCRIMSALVFEEVDVADSTEEQFCDPQTFSVGGDILSSDMENLLEAGTSVWQHNGAMLASWGSFARTFSPAFTSATYTNLIDASSTTVSATSPGFTLNTLYHGSRTDSAVNVEIGVVARRNSGSGALNIRFSDGTNNVDFTGITPTTSSFALTSTTTTIPRLANTKFDLMAASADGTSSWDVDAVAMWLYK